jgi:hypothetical protein
MSPELARMSPELARRVSYCDASEGELLGELLK